MDLTLTVHPGRELGTRPSRRSRADGQVPAVVYGQGSEPVSVLVAWPELRKVLTTEAGMNALITLNIEGHNDTNLSIIKDLQRHPTRRDVIHVDFQLISADEALTVEVPINLVGTAKAVHDKKGTVDQLMFTLTIQAKPGFIPTALEADISEIDVGTGVRVGEIALPDGVSTEVDLDEVVVQGSQSRATIEEEEAAAAEGEEGEEGEGEGGEGDGEGDSGGES